MSSNNKSDRMGIVRSIWFLREEKKEIEKKLKEIQKIAISKLSHRGIEKEEYKGFKVSVTRSSYSKLNKDKLAKRLEITRAELDEAIEKCTENFDKSPYLTITKKKD